VTHIDAQQIISGLAIGSVYGMVALALVLIFRATSILNFAQGEMATFSTYIGWSLIVGVGLPYWVGFSLAIVIAALLGLLTYFLAVYPVQRAQEFTIVMVTFGLFYIYNGLSTTVWDPNPRPFPTPFKGSDVHLFGAVIDRPSIGIFGIVLIIVVVLAVLFRTTWIGLALRAAAQNPTAARLMGVNTTAMYALGWILASVVGAIAGILVANVLLLTPALMLNVLIYSFLAAIVGGLTSPAGAIIGGLLVGVADNIAGSTSFIGSDLRTPVMLLFIVIVLLVRPAGLFGKVVQAKV
jgi:branched-chain amino acid transport system permease protein